MKIRTTILRLIAERKRSSQRRGTILILAIAVLAVLSLLAISYVTIVRVDRDSSDAVAVSRDFDQQVGTVIRHMQTLIAADMFGNKVVTTSTPRFAGNGDSIWPTMFEDGEFADIDRIDAEYRSGDPDANPSLGNGRRLEATGPASQRIAPPDDAWLASTEPRWPGLGLPDNGYFEQFSNLRSAYVWDAQEEAWIRGDGLFVDLAQWFLNPVDGRANAGVDLLDPSGSEVTDVRTANYTRGDYVRSRDSIDYFRQMSQLTPGGDPTILKSSDERFFVDTTGDLRPDSQWTQLEELGNLFGLNWVVAARITDASALVNLNTAIESPAYRLVAGGSDASGRNYSEVIGTGETPADVDLVRLLTYNYGQNPPNAGFENGNPNLNRIMGDGVAFWNHLDEGRGFLDVLRPLQENSSPGYFRALDPNVAGPGQNVDSWEWQINRPTTRNQRRYLYEQAYSRTDGLYPNAQRYPERAMLDLHAFWGSNNATLISKPEQYLDGPENGGYLPLSSNSNPDNGPLRSAEIRVPDIRAFGNNANARPTFEQLQFDTRRYLTTTSGAGQYSPVPVVNKGQTVTEFDGSFFRQKHNLARNERAFDLPEIFADLVWALAPFATDRELSRTANGSVLPTDQFGLPNFHYGGDTAGNGPAERFAALYNSPQIGASYAIHRAAALAVNLAAARSTNSTGHPRILRFFPSTLPQTQLPLFPGYDVSYANTRFAHGDIDLESSQTIRDRYLGRPNGGISFIGVNRQPFLVEAHTLAVYQHDEMGISVTIDPDDPNNYVGSIIAFEVANPWGDVIEFTSGQDRGGYVFRIVREESWLELRGPTVEIEPGERIVFYWISSPDDSPFDASIMDTIRDNWIATVEGGSNAPRVVPIGVGNDATISNKIQDSIGGGSPLAIPFQNMATGLNGRTQVQLIRRTADLQNGGQNNSFAPPAPERKGDILVDRMTTASTSDSSGDGIVWNDFFGALRTTKTETFTDSDGAEAPGNFRVVVHGSMRRSPNRPAGQEGFPAYVVESPGRNEIHVETAPDASGASGNFNQLWFETDFSNPLVGPPPLPVLTNPSEGLTLGADDLRDTFNDLPEFQLYIPGDQFSSVSDLLLVPAFSHMYFHSEVGYPNTQYSIIRVNEFSTRYANSNTADHPGFAGDAGGGELEGRWLTFSEQLGFDFHLDGNLETPAIDPNPWFGRIDPTHYRFNSTLANVVGLPDHMAVPLGSRIVDLFTTINAQDFLIPGTININTASRRVLGLLPLAEPLQQIGDGSGASPATLQATPPNQQFGTANSRAGRLFAYREREGEFGQGPAARSNWTNIAGLRNVSANGEGIAARGFVSIGEIPLIGQFQANGLPQAGNVGTFLELVGSATNAKGPPFETWSDTGRPLSYGVGADQERAYAFNDFNPANDAEEQLALFRSLANIVSTRSDVFMATFVIRGYDPDIIESIEVNGDALDAMNDPLFRPAYESRWLVVFDRSNVRSPIDRPRVLLKMELPSAVP